MDELRKIRFRSLSRNGNDSEITISGVSADDAEKLEAVLLRGYKWVKGNPTGDRLDFADNYQPPRKETDDNMLPFWRPVNPKRDFGVYQTELFDAEFNPIGHSPQITIQSLCGYHYSPEKYREEAEKLEAYGFICLRSRRDDFGKFCEIWYLPGLWAAKGGLHDVLDRINDHLLEANAEKARLERALAFLCRHVSFGTLDVSVQRAAMVMDD